MSLLSKLKEYLNIDEGREEKSRDFLRNIIILGMIGTLLLLLGNSFLFQTPTNLDDNKKSPSVQPEVPDLSYEEKIARELESTLSLMEGVGKVKVTVYVTKSPSYVYEYNNNNNNKITRETDQNGGVREIEEGDVETELVVISDASGNEKPVVKEEKYPKLTGVLIVAQGAENSHIKDNIMRAVSNFLQLPIHRINVLPYQRR